MFVVGVVCVVGVVYVVCVVGEVCVVSVDGYHEPITKEGVSHRCSKDNGRVLPGNL